MAYKALLTSRRGPITPTDVGIEGAHRFLRVPPVGLQDKCGVPRISQRPRDSVKKTRGLVSTSPRPSPRKNHNSSGARFYVALTSSRQKQDEKTGCPGPTLVYV